MPKAPAFQFYPKEYLSDYKVLRMSWEAQGIYWNLLSHIWNDTKTQYSIKNDPESIRAIFKLSKKTFEKVFKQIQWPDDPILKEEHGMLISERLKEEKEKQEVTSIKRQEAANKRWGKKESKSNASALHKECSAFASPIATSLKDFKPPIVPLAGNGECVSEIIEGQKADKEKVAYTPEFEALWSDYSWKENKKGAFKKYKVQLKRKDRKVKPEVLHGAVKNYIAHCKETKRKVMLGKTFFGPEDRWEDFQVKPVVQEQQHGTGKKPKPIQDGVHSPQKEEHQPPEPKNPEAGFTWQLVLEKLESQVEPESFDTWFGPTIGYDLEGDRLIVAVPNQLFANWFNDHYAELIGKVLKGREVEFVVVRE